MKSIDKNINRKCKDGKNRFTQKISEACGQI